MKWWKWVVVVCSVVVVAAIATAVIVLNRPPIAGSLRKQIGFEIYYPSGTSIEGDKASVKYDSGNKILSYNATGLADFVITEQSTPETMVDVPQVYDKLLESLNEYDSLDTPIGKATLTKPKNADNDEVGVINSNGTLMFVRAKSNLSNSQWQQVFADLPILH